MTQEPTRRSFSHDIKNPPGGCPHQASLAHPGLEAPGVGRSGPHGTHAQSGTDPQEFDTHGPWPAPEYPRLLPGRSPPGPPNLQRRHTAGPFRGTLGISGPATGRCAKSGQVVPHPRTAPTARASRPGALELGRVTLDAGLPVGPQPVAAGLPFRMSRCRRSRTRSGATCRLLAASVVLGEGWSWLPVGPRGGGRRM